VKTGEQIWWRKNDKGEYLNYTYLLYLLSPYHRKWI